MILKNGGKKEMDKDGIYNKEIYVRCSAGCEVLHFGFDKECGTHDIAMFKYANHGKLNLVDRLRYCWHILIRGEAYGDDMIISRESAKKLHGYLGLCEYEIHQFEQQKQKEKDDLRDEFIEKCAGGAPFPEPHKIKEASEQDVLDAIERSKESKVDDSEALDILEQNEDEHK
jgi:hypothetical protein